MTAKRPAVPVPSATLILVRESAGRIQVYLMRRSRKSGFMPGSFVFPGGQVERTDSDRNFWHDRIDLTPEEVIDRLGPSGEVDALGYAVAAVRETFEEAQALIAESRPKAPADYEAACAFRAAHGTDPGWFQRLMADGKWTLQLSALARWKRWITPLAMPRRFDTRFFIAALPMGQQCRVDRREASEGIWLSPREALSANLSGALPLTPPGLVTLHQLLGHTSWSSLRAAAGRPWNAGIMPRLIALQPPGQALILMPWDPQYGAQTPEIQTADLQHRVLDPLAPFSRVWNDGMGVWRPVR